MKNDYATIAASTVAALLLAVSPAVAGDGKKASGDVSTDTSTSGTTGGTLSTDSPSASPKMGDDKGTIDAEKKTGLDRADQAAGEHGQQGRDNAREKQEQNDSSSASPRMDDQKTDPAVTTTEEKK